MIVFPTMLYQTQKGVSPFVVVRKSHNWLWFRLHRSRVCAMRDHAATDTLSPVARNTRFAVVGGVLATLLSGAVLEAFFRRRSEAREQGRSEEVQRTWREAADAANRSNNEFLSGMGHALRAPLNAVLGFAQLLEVEDLTEFQTEAVDQILEGGRTLLSLINEAADIAPIEAGTDP
jgi:signal transduction histidine kinase